MAYFNLDVTIVIGIFTTVFVLYVEISFWLRDEEKKSAGSPNDAESKGFGRT